MNRIEQVFGTRHVLLPVIHPIDELAAMRSVETCVAAGVRGIFLINQGLSTDEVLELVNVVHRQHPELWVGINLLGFAPAHVMEHGLEAGNGRLDGIWSDNANVDEGASEQPAAQEFVTARRNWTGLYFGGVAFKYQREVAADKLAHAAAIARPFMDVVCTSGPGTGQAADTAKIAALAGGLGASGALALASGVTAANVGAYLPYVHAFLVGTGIEERFGVIDPAKVAELQHAITDASK